MACEINWMIRFLITVYFKLGFVEFAVLKLSSIASSTICSESGNIRLGTNNTRTAVLPLDSQAVKIKAFVRQASLMIQHLKISQKHFVFIAQ
ncbi:hypothetical protein C7H79_11505 [Nitrosomonas supralitoralis]|uniref:Uncharacterized protein n=1 Tax=Nitrosomonas supralitoralis TaxID=2116706 RepID=A0A2P7NTH2_9PROT|nr:hypothetical protein C7H79_11505 [Nitrosomonas supralitoralis]